jgi:hypothetical protein
MGFITIPDPREEVDAERWLAIHTEELRRQPEVREGMEIVPSGDPFGFAFRTGKPGEISEEDLALFNRVLVGIRVRYRVKGNPLIR